MWHCHTTLTIEREMVLINSSSYVLRDVALGPHSGAARRLLALVAPSWTLTMDAMDASERDDNIERQAEEAEALSAIYGDDFSQPPGASGSWLLRIPTPECAAETDDVRAAIFAATGRLPPDHLTVRVVPVETYPSRSPPVVELDPRHLPFGRHDVAMDAVEETWAASKGEVMVFGYVERLRSMLGGWRDEDAAEARRRKTGEGLEDAASEGRSDGAGANDGDEKARGGDGGDHPWDPVALEEELAALAIERSMVNDADAERRLRSTPSDAGDEGPGFVATEEDVAKRIVHGAPFTVMKSTFQAHLCTNLTREDEVDAVMAVLRRNSKVARATHNIMAYRIRKANGAWAQDHDEDGENAAGGRLLHMLQVTKATNVCVVVSRWYGGVLLGPDRFRQINNAARELLERCGEIQGATGSGKGGGGKK